MNDLTELDTLIKELEDVDVISLYQDNAHALELAHHNDVFFVRLDGNNLYAGPDGDKAASVFYHQVAQIHDDEQRGSDPSFAALREILQARNDHVREMLAAIGHDHLAASLDGIELAKEFTTDGFLNIIKHNRSNLDVLAFVRYRPAEKENEECHTCIFFAAGGYCTKLDLPVKEEMYCDLFKSLPKADKNEEWATASNQPWEEPESDEIDGVQKDVRDLIYTSDEDLESPANYKTDSRKPNVIMREYVPEDANEGFAFLVKNVDDDGIEIRLTQRDGDWFVISKQRDVSDLGDPFQSVGDVYIPKKVKLQDDADVEGKEKLARVRGQRAPNILGEATVPRRIKAQSDQFRNLDYSDIDEGRVEKGLSNEGGLGIDDPEALNDGTAASSQHYRRMKEEEENKKSSLAMKAYANPEKDAQKPIDPDEDGREALSSAETGTGTQAFSSGAVIDISPDETDGVNVNTKASGGTGGEGVEGGGDGSVTMIAPKDSGVSPLPKV